MYLGERSFDTFAIRFAASPSLATCLALPVNFLGVKRDINGVDIMVQRDLHHLFGVIPVDPLALAVRHGHRYLRVHRFPHGALRVLHYGPPLPGRQPHHQP